MQRAVLSVAALFLWGCADNPATFPVARSEVNNSAAFARGPMGVIVRLKAGNPDELAIAHAAKRVYRHALKGFAANLSAQAVDALRHNPNVESVTPDGIMRLAALSWGQDRTDQRTNVQDGQFLPPGDGTGVHAYIIDSGILRSHDEFDGRATIDADFSGATGDDCLGHGTHVAGTLGGQFWGIARNVRLHAVRIFGCSSTTETSVVLAAIDWVAANAVAPAVVNLSIYGDTSSVMDGAIANLISRGLVVVVAAGNDGLNACNYSPARAASAITVGATDASDTRWPASNWGECLDIFAPGYRILSAWSSFDGGNAISSGTSMAAPHVAGVAALILGAQPNLSPTAVDSIIAARSTKDVVQDANSPKWGLIYSGLDDMVGVLPPPVVPQPPLPPSNFAVQVVSLPKGKTKTASLRATWADSQSPHPSSYSLTAQGAGAFTATWPATSLSFSVQPGIYDFYITAVAVGGSSARVGPVRVVACDRC